MMRPYIASIVIVAALQPAALASDTTVVPAVATTVAHAAFTRTSLADALAAEIGRPTPAVRRAWSRAAVRQASSPNRSWARRHPVLLGTLVGFGAGFGLSFAGGDDGVFGDFTGSANGVMLGGIGAGAGAIVGAIAADVR